MKHSFIGGAAALVSGLMMAWGSQAVAVNNCRGKIKPTNGTVTVQGDNVTGTLKWCTSAQADCSSPQNCQPIPDPSCISGGRARNCQLSSDPLGRITPPDTCTVCLQDDGADSCGAYVRGCIPGARALPGISARVYNSTDIPIPSGVTTVLTFDSERWDTDGIHSPGGSRLTAPTAGKYFIYGHIRWQVSGAGTYRIVDVRVTGLAGNAIVASAGAPIASAEGLDQNVATHFELQAGEFVEFLAGQDSGGSLNITAVQKNSPEFGMVKLP